VLVDFSLQYCTHPTPLPASRYDLFRRALCSETTLLRERLWRTGISAATVHLRSPTNVARCCWSCRSMIGMGLPSLSMRSIQSDWSENRCLQVDQQNTTTAGAARRQHGLGGFLVGRPNAPSSLSRSDSTQMGGARAVSAATTPRTRTLAAARRRGTATPRHAAQPAGAPGRQHRHCRASHPQRPSCQAVTRPLFGGVGRCRVDADAPLLSLPDPRPTFRTAAAPPCTRRQRAARVRRVGRALWCAPIGPPPPLPCARVVQARGRTVGRRRRLAHWPAARGQIPGGVFGGGGGSAAPVLCARPVRIGLPRPLSGAGPTADVNLAGPIGWPLSRGRRGLPPRPGRRRPSRGARRRAPHTSGWSTRGGGRRAGAGAWFRLVHSPAAQPRALTDSRPGRARPPAAGALPAPRAALRG